MVLPGCLFVCHLILLRMCFLFNCFVPRFFLIVLPFDCPFYEFIINY